MPVKQTFSGDSTALIREYQKIQRQQIKLEQQIAKSNASQAQGVANTKRMKSSLDGIVANVGAFAAGFVSVHAAAKLVTEEMELQRRLAREAKMAAISLADSQAAVAKNIGDVSDEAFQAFVNRVQNIAVDTGFQSPSQLNVAASGLLSATAGNQELTLELLKTAAPFFKDAPEQLGVFASRMGDIMKATGSSNAKETMALMLAIQGQSRFEDLSAFGNVAPALKASVVTQQGVDRTQATREAAALFAAIGGAIGDTEGAVTKTAVANLSANLERVIGGDGMSVMQRLAIAQQKISEGGEEGERVKEAILQSGFEGAIKPTIRQLISDSTSETAVAARESLDKITASEDFVDRKRKQLMSGTSQLELANLTREQQARRELAAAQSPDAAIAAARDEARQALERASIPGDFLTNKLNRSLIDVESMQGLRMRLLQQETQIRQSPTATSGFFNTMLRLRGGGVLPAPVRPRSDDELSRSELAKIEQLRSAAEALERLAEVQQRMSSDDRATPDSRPSAAAVQTRVHDERE